MWVRVKSIVRKIRQYPEPLEEAILSAITMIGGIIGAYILTISVSQFIVWATFTLALILCTAMFTYSEK